MMPEGFMAVSQVRCTVWSLALFSLLEMMCTLVAFALHTTNMHIISSKKKNTRDQTVHRIWLTAIKPSRRRSLYPDSQTQLRTHKQYTYPSPPTSFIRTTLEEDRIGRKTYLRMTGSVASRIIVAPRPGLDPLAPPSCDGPLLP